MSLPFWLDHLAMIVGLACAIAPLAVLVAMDGLQGDWLIFIRLAVVSLAIVAMLYWVIWRSNYRMYVLGQEIEYRAYHDSLTGLHNRSRWYELAHERHTMAARAIKPCSLLYLDIDRFKTINDRYGHDTGDQVLQAVTRVLVQDTRESDVLARFGGEEFVVLLPGVDLPGAIACAQRLHRSMTTIDMLPQAVTVSIGVAESLPIETLDQMINRADRALLQAKETGRNRTVIATGDTFSSLSAHATPHYALDPAQAATATTPFSVAFPTNAD
jgi:diguanylate cyclase (GGDEF)-like protein